ncbi:hypothetical protein KCU65_g290, partial [Aureobasidium melanogenum]
MSFSIQEDYPDGVILPFSIFFLVTTFLSFSVNCITNAGSKPYHSRLSNNMSFAPMAHQPRIPSRTVRGRLLRAPSANGFVRATSIHDTGPAADIVTVKFGDVANRHTLCISSWSWFSPTGVGFVGAAAFSPTSSVADIRTVLFGGVNGLVHGSSHHSAFGEGCCDG